MRSRLGRVRRLHRVALVLISCSLTRLASAEVTFDWKAPAACPAADAVHRRIELQLGHALSEHPETVSYSASVSGGEGQPWRLDLSLEREGASHARRLEASSCEALAELAAVVVVLALKPSIDASEPASAASVDEEPAGGRAERLAAEPAPRGGSPLDPFRRPAPESPIDDAAAAGRLTAATEEGSVVGEIGITGGVDLNALPRVALSTRVGVAVVLDSLYALEGRMAFLPEQRFSFQGGASMDARVIAGDALACVQGRASGWMQGRACLGAEVGRLDVTGHALGDARSSSLGWGGPLGSAALSWVVSPRFRLGASVSALMPLARHAFRFEGLGEVYRLPLATVRVEAGLAGQLWE